MTEKVQANSALSSQAETEADEAVLSLALSTKLLAKDLGKKLKALRTSKEEDADLTCTIDAAKLIMALSDSALKLGRRAEEITNKRKREMETLPESKLKELAHSPVGSTTRIIGELSGGYLLKAEMLPEEQ